MSVWRIYQPKWALSLADRSSAISALYLSFSSCSVSSVRSLRPKAGSMKSNSKRRCTSLLFSRNSARSLCRPHRMTIGAPSVLRIRVNSLSSWFTSEAFEVGNSFCALVISRMPSFSPAIFLSKSLANSSQSAASTLVAGFFTTPLASIFDAMRLAIKFFPVPESPRIRQSRPMRVPPWATILAT